MPSVYNRLSLAYRQLVKPNNIGFVDDATGCGSIQNIKVWWDELTVVERAIADVLIPSITGHYCTQGERELLVLPVRMGGLGLTKPSQEAGSECVASANISEPLAQQIKSQVHEPPDETEIHAAQREMCQVKY